MTEAQLTDAALPHAAGFYQMAATGLDTVQFRLAAAPAEPFHSLAAVASGGESARVMLAMKAAPALIQQLSGQNGSYTAGELIKRVVCYWRAFVIFWLR